MLISCLPLFTRVLEISRKCCIIHNCSILVGCCSGWSLWCVGHWWIVRTVAEASNQTLQTNSHLKEPPELNAEHIGSEYRRKFDALSTNDLQLNDVHPYWDEVSTDVHFRVHLAVACCSWVQFCDGCAELLKFHGGLEGQETWQKLSKQLEVLTVLVAVWLNSVPWWKDWKARWRCHLPANHEPIESYWIAIFHIEPSEWAWKAEVDNLNT